MAIDTLVLTRVSDGEDVLGSHQRLRVYDVTPSAQYPTGGYTLDPSRVGLKVIRAVFLGSSNTAALGVVPWYNSETGTLYMLWSAGAAAALAEITGDTNQSTFSYRLWFLGE